MMSHTKPKHLLSPAAIEILKKKPHDIPVGDATYMALDRYDVHSVAELVTIPEDRLRSMLSFDFKASNKYYRRSVSEQDHQTVVVAAVQEVKNVLASHDLSLGMTIYDMKGQELSLKQILEMPASEIASTRHERHKHFNQPCRSTYIPRRLARGARMNNPRPR